MRIVDAWCWLVCEWERSCSGLRVGEVVPERDLGRGGGKDGAFESAALIEPCEVARRCDAAELDMLCYRRVQVGRYASMRAVSMAMASGSSETEH